MDFDKAGQAHGEWKVKFRLAMKNKEQMDAARVSADNLCDLGKWLHGEGQSKHGADPLYRECVAKHAEFHREAGKVAQVINGGKYAEAEAMLNAGTPFAAASFSTIAAIGRLKSNVTR